MTILPDQQALQTFYGTLPLLLVVAAGFLRFHRILKK